MTLPSSTWFTLGLALVGLTTAAADPLDDLVSNSPFSPHSSASTQIATDEATTLEFRGLMIGSEGPVFGLYDRTRNQSTWVRQNEKGTDCNVVSYDANAQVVNVDYQGKRLSLALFTSKIGVATATPVAVIPNAPVVTSATGANSNDQNRLESIAAEVRRRRVLRMSAPGATTTPAPAVAHP